MRLPKSLPEKLGFKDPLADVIRSLKKGLDRRRTAEPGKRRSAGEKPVYPEEEETYKCPECGYETEDEKGGTPPRCPGCEIRMKRKGPEKVDIAFPEVD